jgi:hypothetical protein
MQEATVTHDRDTACSWRQIDSTEFQSIRIRPGNSPQREEKARPARLSYCLLRTVKAGRGG